DAHPELGNNAQLARRLGFEPDRNDDGTPVNFGPYDLVWRGRCEPCTLAELGRRVGSALGREPLVLGDANKLVSTVAWCTGGAQDMMEAAIDSGVDADRTGEAPEPTVHLATDTAPGLTAAGHRATERYGIQAPGEAVARESGVQVECLGVDNPS